MVEQSERLSTVNKVGPQPDGEHGRIRSGRLGPALECRLSGCITPGRALLLIAIAAGVTLRFYRLDAASMTADEGAAWAAAVEPVQRLLQLQPQLDSGKLALYDLLLHYWIGIFGDSLRSMRSLSAALDSISILLMFAVLRELFAMAGRPRRIGELAGGFAALIFATNVALLQSARIARMYPLMTAAELVQILFFVRAQHRRGILNCILAALFLALATATNFTALFVFAVEGTWIGYLILAKSRCWPGARLRIAAPGLSLVAGLALLMPFAQGAFATSREAVKGGVLDWISYQTPWDWSYGVLRNGAGNRSLFRSFLLLAGLGVWRQRKRAPLVLIFMLLMGVVPFAAVAIISVAGRPMEVDRYVLLGLIGFLGLAAIGAATFESKLGQLLVFALIAWLSVRALRHSSTFWVDWKGAVAIACTASTGRAGIGVVPGYAVNAVRYHLAPELRSLAVGLDSQCGNAQILIFSPGHFLSPRYVSELRACYPHVLGRAKHVEVRAR